MITFQQIQYIIALSEERHFIKASERSFVTQPTLSMQIKKAEEMLGHLIFDRSRNPIELTAFGEELLPLLREIQSDFSRMMTLKEKADGTYIERLRVAVIPTIAAYLVPDLFKKWKEELQDVELIITELKTEEVLHALEQKRVDVGIIAGPVFDERLRINPLFKEEIKAYYPTSAADEINAEELEDQHPWLLTSGNCLRTQMMNFCGIKKEDHEHWNYEGGNMELLMKMVDLEGGYTLVPANYKQGKKELKSIRSREGLIPVRDIIALSAHRSIKWGATERLIRSIQARYGSDVGNRNYQVLSWK